MNKKFNEKLCHQYKRFFELVFVMDDRVFSQMRRRHIPTNSLCPPASSVSQSEGVCSHGSWDAYRVETVGTDFVT